MLLASMTIALLIVAADIDARCQALIDANAQSLDSIRTIQLEYTNAWIEKPGQPVAVVSWSRDGRKERIKVIGYPNGPPVGAQARMTSDLVINGDTFKFLRDWDPENPKSITPSNQGKVRADIIPKSNVIPGAFSPCEQLRFDVDALPRRSLSDLAKVSPSVSCKRVSIDGRDLWMLSLETPEETTATTMKKHFEVYLDPAAGHLIRRLVVHTDVLRPNRKIEKDWRAHEVTEFKDFGDGIFVPMRVRNGNLKIWGTEMVVRSVTVNEPVPPETFEMQWPKFVVISHHPLVGRHLKQEVWGDGKSLGVVGADGNIAAFEATLRKDPLIAAELGPEPSVRPPAPTSAMFKLTIALGVLVVIIVAIVLVRRVREQRA